MVLQDTFEKDISHLFATIALEHYFLVVNSRPSPLINHSHAHHNIDYLLNSTLCLCLYYHEIVSPNISCFGRCHWRYR